MTQSVADHITTWKALAACRGVATSTFFDGPVEAAKRVCAECPARIACLTEYLFEVDGVFGGLSYDERRALVLSLKPRPPQERRPLPVTAASEDPLAGTGRQHGTVSGNALCKCPACKAAKAKSESDRRRAHRTLQAAGLEIASG